ncbi:MAG TPA: recombinase family protein [Thermoanaerobaculia bacterium]|jgi:site-specific DNA recombinase|nr:recombinase family protein [Thermoanaerobaculia bacterium]
MPHRSDVRGSLPLPGEKRPEKQVGLWIRVSTEDQVKGESPEHHEARGRMYAEMKGWTVAKVYRLDAISGKSVMGRPETAEMLEDVRSSTITGLIFSKLARLARNTKELLEFADIFRREGADLISLAESIDTSSPAGRFFYTLIAALAEWEREEISARIAASVPIRAKLGKRTAGQAPYGYSWDERSRLVVNPATAPVLKLMYELFQEHRRIGKVVRLINEAGYRNRKGRPFPETSVARIIANPVAKGLHRSNYSRSDGVKRLLKPEADWVWNTVEPVVSEELWNECNALLSESAAKVKRQGRPAVQLFSGVAVCECGMKMYVPSNTPKWVCKKCRNKIPIVDLEKVFQEKLRDFFLDPVQVADYLGQGDEALAEKEVLLETLVRERSRVSLEMDKLYRLYQADELSAKSFGERHRPLEERASQLDAEIPRLQGEIDFLTIQQLSAADFATEAGSLYVRWPELSFDERREIVERVVERIVVGSGEIEINLFYEPPSIAPPHPPPKLVAKSHRHQTTVEDWSTSRPTYPCARSGWPRAGTPTVARGSSSTCPACGHVF